MSSKTKIMVFHMKELIYTGIFIVLGILFLVLLAIMFLPGKGEKKKHLPKRKVSMFPASIPPRWYWGITP